jgi:pimeloyl-ACP methyl ester carboxylesterase
MSISHLAVHDLGGAGPTALYAHANGFHSRCWSPIADHLPGLHNIAYDARGHGDSPVGTGWPEETADGPLRLHWSVYGRDNELVARALADSAPLIGVGHSLGGATMLMAALAAPELFCGLVVYEPIVFPSEGFPGRQESIPPLSHALAAAARRRRDTFESFEAAIANYASKPPLNLLEADVLDAYVRYGFDLGDDGRVHLKCTPEHEARTFEVGGSDGTWEHLEEVLVPVWVISGRPEPGAPSALASTVARRVPDGRYLQLDQFGHFGPMQSPAEIAAIIADAARTFRPGLDEVFRA